MHFKYIEHIKYNKDGPFHLTNIASDRMKKVLLVFKEQGKHSEHRNVVETYYMGLVIRKKISIQLFSRQYKPLSRSSYQLLYWVLPTSLPTTTTASAHTLNLPVGQGNKQTYLTNVK